MFRGVMPPPPPGPFSGPFPPRPPPPRFGPPGRPPMPPPGVFGRMPMRPPLRVFGPPPPPPPPFLRGPGAMRSRPLFRPPKFSPYPMGGKVKNGNLATPASAAKKAAAVDGTNPSPAAASNGNAPTTVTTNGTEGAESSSSSNGGTATTNSGGSKDGVAAAVEAAKRDGIPVDMIQALYCKLCDAKLNGSLQATAHYVGKSHAKKVKQYQHGQGRTAQQRPSPATNGNKPATESSKRPIPDTLEKFCKLCDVAFTSEIQAKQHYDGRNHQRRMRGEPPLPKGFYNPVTGRWQRQPPPGMAMKGAPPQQQQLRKPAGGGAFYCESCHTSMTSQQQLDAHLQGAKHKARVGGLASAVTAQVVTANAAAAAAAAAATAAGGPTASSSQVPQPYVALVPGPTMTRVAPCGTC